MIRKYCKLFGWQSWNLPSFS